MKAFLRRLFSSLLTSPEVRPPVFIEVIREIEVPCKASLLLAATVKDDNHKLAMGLRDLIAGVRRIHGRQSPPIELTRAEDILALHQYKAGQ